MAAPSASVAETHSAWVFFVGDRAYKLKKPIDLGFLDFRTREAREAVCHREVELNRRLAPDVYLGVADITGPDGELADHLVVMRRLPPERRLSSLALADEPLGGPLREVAHQLAALHAASPPSPAADRAAGLPALRSRWNDNTSSLMARAGSVVDEATIALVHGLACRYLDGRGALFASRVASGRAVDGHGDLLADDIFCMDDGPRVLDCLEFADDFRLGDGLADAAFLAMDLERLDRPDLAAVFLDAYAEDAADAWPASLAHHHVAYRAQVRAKVSAIRAEQGDAAAGASARRLLELAAAHLEQGRIRLLLVGGSPGTGKSTLAAGLGMELGATVMRSDEIRKEIHGVGPDESAAAPVDAGIYGATATGDTYATMLDRAETALGMGETVILDATWSEAGWRTRARALAQRTSADLLELVCTTPAAVADDRILARQARGDDPSDASPSVAIALRDRFEDWPEATSIDTSGSIEASRAAARPLLHRVA